MLRPNLTIFDQIRPYWTRCRADADKAPVGSDPFFTKKGLAWGGNKSDKGGKCACACGGVLGA
jgi:hypothetical protein